MKDKTKKILAGVALGCIGATTLAGCSMSDEQQAALDKVVNKADEIVKLVENQNKQLSKQEAYEMIVFSDNVFKFGLVEDVEIKVSGKRYFNYFEKEEDAPDDQTVKFRLKDNVKYFQLITYDEDRGEGTFNVIADYTNNIYHYWNTENETLTEENALTYEDSAIYTIGGNLLSFIKYADCTVDDIVDIEVSEDNQYSFKFFKENTDENTGYVTSNMFNIIVKDNLIRKAEKYSVIEDLEAALNEIKIHSEYVCAEFNYDNNFDNFVEKHNSLLNKS